MMAAKYENDHCPNCGGIQRIKVEYDPMGNHGPSYTCTNCNQNINLSTRILKAIWSGVTSMFNAACAADKWVDKKIAEVSYQCGVEDFIGGKGKNLFADKYYTHGWDDAKKKFPGPR